MANSVETYAFPEMTLYAWTGASSALVAYADSVDVQVSRSLSKFLYPITGVGYAARTQYVETDKSVTVTVGTLYAGASLYGMLASGANISATVNFIGAADSVTSTFTIWSGQMPDFQLQAQDGQIVKQKVKIIAPDCSGL